MATPTYPGSLRGIHKTAHRACCGFSLIELLIVVAIILIVAAIAIPNLMRSRMRANESSAVAIMRTINTAQNTYLLTYGSYSDNLQKMANPRPGTPVSRENAGLIDWVLGCEEEPCFRSGYNFDVDDIARATNDDSVVVAYLATGVPISNNTGTRGFCTDQHNAISVDPEGGKECTVPLEQ